MIAGERLYLDSNRSRVVREGDPAAAFLLAAKGSEIDPRYVKLVKSALSANTESADKPKRQTRIVKPLSER